jgi:GT2 family glycosyltransferase
MRIAALLTCFNRKEKTLLCLKHLFEIAPSIEIYLVDDGSTDGTSKAIVEQFPMVKIIQGDGNLFWNRGMHLAWREAAKNDYDFYLWLNDDVYLYDYFLEELLNVYNQFNKNIIVAGVVESEDKSQILYGGYDKNKRLIVPRGTPRQIISLNGNVVLISREIFHQVGNLDPVYHHDLGDVDYGLRGTKKGVCVYTTSFPIASGEKNAIKRERLQGATLQKRFKRLYAPLGSNPNINFYFRIKHKSFANALTYYVFQHFLNIIPDRTNSLLFGKKYM